MTNYFLLCMILLQNCYCLDFYFFSKFYNQGHCKSLAELQKYVYKSIDNTESPSYDRVETLMLTNKDEPIVDFGVYLSSSHKTQLNSAHNFFNDLLPNMSETERVYFPDMISCVQQIPFFSFWGLRDTYGMLYKLSPSLTQNQKDDMSGNSYSFLDYVEIYLDVFKALKTIVKNQYYLDQVTDDDIGVVELNEGINTHIRGKFRHLHSLRKQASFCSVDTSNYDLNTDELLLGTVNPCQVRNALDLWGIFKDHVINYYNINQQISFNVDSCLNDRIDRKALNCPKEMKVLWEDTDLRWTLTNLNSKSLLYSSDSVVDYYIYVLERLKTDFLDQSLTAEERRFKKRRDQMKQSMNQISKDQKKMNDLEKLEYDILNKFKNKKRNSSEPVNKLDEVIQDLNIDISNTEYQHNTVDKHKMSQLIHDLEAQDSNSSEIAQLKEAEKNKQIIANDGVANKMALEQQLEDQKKQVRSNFQRIIKKAYMRHQADQMIKQMKESELNKIQEQKNPNSQQKKRIERYKPPMNSSDPNVLVDDSIDENFQTKANPLMNQAHILKTSNKTDDSSDISGYDEEQSNTLNNLELMKDEMEEDTNDDPMLLNLKREEESVFGIKIDFNNRNINQKLIDDFESEVRDNEHTLVQIGDQSDHRSEDNIIIEDKSQADFNLQNIIKHDLIGEVLNTASLEVQEREVSKLEEVEFIYKLKKEIQDLVDQGVDPSDEQVNLKKLAIEQKVSTLIARYGAAEILFEENDGLVHYTLGDLQDDLSLGELTFIQKMPELTSNKKDLGKILI